MLIDKNYEKFETFNLFVNLPFGLPVFLLTLLIRHKYRIINTDFTANGIATSRSFILRSVPL